MLIQMTKTLFLVVLNTNRTDQKQKIKIHRSIGKYQLTTARKVTIIVIITLPMDIAIRFRVQNNVESMSFFVFDYKQR